MLSRNQSSRQRKVFLRTYLNMCVLCTSMYCMYVFMSYFTCALAWLASSGLKATKTLLVFLSFGYFSFAGILACLDGYMNIAMEQTEEYVNGQLKNKYGDAFIRGNNGNY